jgi:hypothetical protein
MKQLWLICANCISRMEWLCRKPKQGTKYRFGATIVFSEDERQAQKSHLPCRWH